MARCDSYDFGQCTRGACDLASWVLDGWGNATDWPAAAARAGFQLTQVPTVGAVMVYQGGNGYSPFGHCGVVLQVAGPDLVLIDEVNFVGFDQEDQRWSNLFDLEAFILPPGVSPGQGGGAGAGPGPGGLPAGLDVAIASWDNLRQYLQQGAQAHEQQLQAIAQALGGIG